MSRRNIIFVIIVILFVGLYLYATAPSSPQSVVQRFYDKILADQNGYLANEGYKNFQEITPEMKDKIGAAVSGFEDGGFDPLLCAQDKPESIKVIPGMIGTSTAQYSVEESFSGQTKNISVGLIRQGSVWKISDISCSGASLDNANRTGERDKVGEYLRQNISNLSSVKEVLGGKFSVTSVYFKQNGGIVNYEDGHIALSATFTYEIDPSGQVKINDFKVLKEVGRGGYPYTQLGNLVKYEGKDQWSIVYDAPGKPGLNNELVFNENSLCTNGAETVYCSSFVFAPGDRVVVEGTLNGEKVDVYRLTKTVVKYDDQ